LLAAIDRGLATRGKGPDLRRFVLIRSIDRHDPRLPDSAFHFVVGAGVKLPEGAIRVRRSWSTSGEVDGDNAELQRYAIAVGIERGAPRPYSPVVIETVSRICGALARPEFGLQLHPGCVVSMGEVPFTRPNEVDADERPVAAAARTRVPLPTPSGNLKIDGRLTVAYELRDTTVGREIGMMLRRQFDGENRGMLFVYPHKAQRRFWMRNCFIPIDLAYIKHGRIEEIVTMPPQPGIPTADLPAYESNTAVRYALEMPGGWFVDHGVVVGDAIEGLAP
jgi:uncharacterized membrane protein (UPF0127 family)